jgi:glycosidase
MPVSSERAHPGLWLACLVGLFACKVDRLEGYGEPPDDGGTFDPTNGQDGGEGYSYTYGDSTESADGGDGDTGGETGPPMCDDDLKRCPAEFMLADAGHNSVDLMGDFAPDGWTVGVPMALSGSTWTTTAPMPWDTQVQYKFRIDGGATWIPDPANPMTVPDGQGGDNSVLAPMTCTDWSCDPGNIGNFDWRDAILYFVFVDRFNNGDPSNDGPIGVPVASDWQGGDWQGVTDKIDEGYFDDLGVNVLWLTVPFDNPNGSGLGVDGFDYSAYHGYWPADLDGPEEHFGTMTELTALVDAAHARDIKVILDYAMNHVHTSSPVYAANPGWFWPNDNGSGGDCVCGSGCGWDGAEGRRCWFTDYLPDFDFTNQAARDYSVDNAMQWIADSGCDGFRLDAVKHIEDQWLLDVRSRVSAEVESVTGEHFYMVGETFTGDRDLIRYYVNSQMLDGQFDFPLRMEIVSRVLMRNGSMADLAGFLASNDGFYGAGIMSTFIGNHDIPRVIHMAEDTPMWASEWADGKDRAWTNQPTLPGGTAAFERMASGFTLIMTLPGAPLIYYGDEIGLPGAGDPDNRRFMQWSSYSSGQQGLLDHVKALTAIRRAHPALRRGLRTPLTATDDTIVYQMSFGVDVVYVVVNRADAARDASGLPAMMLTDELGGGTVTGPSVSVPARSSMILVP